MRPFSKNLNKNKALAQLINNPEAQLRGIKMNISFRPEAS